MEWLVPVIVFGIVLHATFENVKVYDEFVDGAKKGLETSVGILPTLIGLMAAVGILRKSGFLDFLSNLVGKLTVHLGFPSQLVPLAIIRMFSSSAATSLAVDIFKEYGADSRIGMIASVMMSCTESVFYTMSVYFVAVKVKKTRYTLTGALFATLAGIAASTWIAIAL